MKPSNPTRQHMRDAIVQEQKEKKAAEQRAILRRNQLIATVFGSPGGQDVLKHLLARFPHNRPRFTPGCDDNSPRIIDGEQNVIRWIEACINNGKTQTQTQ